MPSEEKHRPIEQPCVSVTNSESGLESPSWHYDAPCNTAQRYEGGQERPVDWQIAKRELRKRAQ